MRVRKTSTRARNKYHFGDHIETIQKMYRHRGGAQEILAKLGIEATAAATYALRAWAHTKGFRVVSKFYWGEHPDEAIAMYQSGKSLVDCVVAFGHTPEDNEFFRRWLHKMNVPLRGQGLRGERHNHWRGGVKMSKGYRMVQHPNGALDKNNRRVYILEHRLVMEQYLGRPLLRDEVVHHKNNDILDNRIENLGLFVNNADHLRQTLKGHVPNWNPEGKARITGRPKKKEEYRQELFL